MASEGNAGDSDPAQVPLSHLDGRSNTGSSNRSPTATSGRLRSASIRFLESSPPSGMWSATGQTLAQAPTPLDIRRGEFSHDGWDGHIQRRNSIVSEESMRRLSRTTSPQTPGSLGRTITNPMDAHPEEDEALPSIAEGKKTSTEPFPQRPRKEADRPAVFKDDDDDPFSKFMGRASLDRQSYTPKPKADPATVAAKRRSADPYAIPDDDDDEEIDPLDDIPEKERPLPKKFQDPAGEAIPIPSEKGEKQTAVTTQATTREPSPSADHEQGPNADGVYPNGYKFPPKHTWGEATIIGLKAFWKFFITPFGFLVVLYGLNVVAWGGMLFLLLIGGGKQFMCYPPGSHGVRECNNINAPRRIWIEIDSQILNALFCVTGFGLIPWRFRDLYYLLQFRIMKKESALRRLAGIHRSWYRLPGSHDIPTDPDAPVTSPETNPAIPLPPSKIPDTPLTGIRAPETKWWKMDYVVWAFVINTFLQATLSGFMWGYNRYKRPSWSTGTFVALACIVAGLGGLMQFQEGKRIKAVEGIPVDEAEMLKDVEQGVGGTEKKQNQKNQTEKKHWGKRKEKQQEQIDEKSVDVSDAS